MPDPAVGCPGDIKDLAPCASYTPEKGIGERAAAGREEGLSTQAEQIGREALPTDLVSPCCGLLFQMAWTDYTDMEATRIPEE